MKPIEYRGSSKEKNVTIPHLLQGGTRLSVATQVLPHGQGRMTLMGKKVQSPGKRAVGNCFVYARVCMSMCVYVCARVLASIWGDGGNSRFQTCCFCLICLLPATVMHFLTLRK